MWQTTDYLSFPLAWLRMVTNWVKADEEDEEDEDGIILWLNSSSFGTTETHENGKRESGVRRSTMIWSNSSTGVAEMASQFGFWFFW